ncbi:MAG: GTP-binding protein [Erysipelotrichaceae bacterium]|nr:GTP-binding protein [Erysipelotrichaceae bacterium]
MIKVDIISGFLGAGKTTLIKKLYKNVFKNEKVVLIENEFGEIGIDGAFLKDSGIEIKEINSGCICCSLVGDFSSSMKEVISKFNPERIIIEPSGVGKLSDIINAVNKVEADLSLNIIATVVDGPKAKIYMKNFGEFFINQVEAANTIVVSKVDKMSEEKLVDLVHLLKEKNEHANIITTAIEQFKDDSLLNILEEKNSLKNELIKEVLDEHEECCHHEHHHHDEDECCCGHHEHDHHDEEDECCCGHHEHHHHDEDECCCGHHEHHHHDEDECCCDHHEHHHHDADEIFTSWGLETPRSISKNQLENFLDRLTFDQDLGLVVRSKGILKASDNEKWYYFDYVSGDYEIRLGEPDYTGRIVVIGSKLDTNKIEKIFENRE